MEIEKLEDYGISESLITRLKELGFKRLTKVQEMAVKKGLFERKNLVISAPTNTGKTFIAELAALSAIKRMKGTRTFYLVPLKAIAEEIFAEFERRSVALECISSEIKKSESLGQLYYTLGELSMIVHDMISDIPTTVLRVFPRLRFLTREKVMREVARILQPLTLKFLEPALNSARQVASRLGAESFSVNCGIPPISISITFKL